MGDNSKIEWTDATWSPVTGCTKVSAGCKNCYAEREWARLSANPKTVYSGRTFTDVQCHPERLDQPLRWSKPRMIFVNSMSDLFHENIPFEFIDAVWLTMIKSQRHIFQILTKRPQRMLEFFEWESGRCDHPVLNNIWLGVSVEDQDTADERIPLLLQTPAAIRWVSAEPLLGPIIMRTGPPQNEITINWLRGYEYCSPPIPSIDWIVAGGESGPRARSSNIDWFRSLRDQCKAAGVPFFMKQLTANGRKIPYELWPRDLHVREYPWEV